MKSKDYWAARSMYELMDGAEKTAAEMSKLYQKSSLYLTHSIEGIFTRYMEKHSLTEEEARALILTVKTPEDIEAIKRKLAVDPKNKELIAELESPAYTVRIERLLELERQIDGIMEAIAKKEYLQTTAFYRELAEESYNRAVMNMQKQIGRYFPFSHVDKKQIDRTLRLDWSGAHYSKRIWHNTDILARDLKTELTVNLITGRTEHDTAQMIMNKHMQGEFMTRRLIRTESCYVASELTAQAYKDHGIERYRYVATLDMRTSTVCRGLDGKVFALKDRKPGTNYPPMHPFCRSTTMADIPADLLKRMKRRSVLPDGTKVMVPADMTYKEWCGKFVDGDKNQQTEIEKHTKKRTDRLQYDRYKTILGDNAPKSFEKFQDLKYNDSESYSRLQDNYKVKNKIKNGVYGSKINPEKQSPHNEETREKGKSYLYGGNDFAQELFDEYAGTGILDKRRRNQEICTAKMIIGVDSRSNTETDMFKIHHSKKRTHIVPHIERNN